MTEEMKMKLFNTILTLEHLADVNHDYFEQANGAFKMLKVIGLDSEYIQWAIGK